MPRMEHTYRGQRRRSVKKGAWVVPRAVPQNAVAADLGDGKHGKKEQEFECPPQVSGLLSSPSLQPINSPEVCLRRHCRRLLIHYQHLEIQVSVRHWETFERRIMTLEAY